VIRGFLSSILGRWPTLHLSLRGTHGEMLGELKIKTPGSYVVCQLNGGLKIERNFFSLKPGLKVQWNFKSLCVSFASHLSLSNASATIWKPYWDEDLIPSFELKCDERSSYELTNQIGQRLRFSFEYISLANLSKTFFREHFWILSGCFPIFIICLMGLIPAQTPCDYQTIDISKIESSIVTKPLTGSGAATTRSKIQNQIRSWSSGPRLPSADTFKKSYEDLLKIKDTETHTSRRGLRDTVRAAWADDLEAGEIEANDLNISAHEIQKSLQPFFSDLKDCYDDVLIRDSSFHGSPRLILRIGMDGRVSDIQIQEMNRSKAASVQMLKECFLGVLRRAQVPKPNQEFLVSRRMYLNIMGSGRLSAR